MIIIPADYEAVRDSCIKKKEKESGKPATKKQVQDCQKMAAIWYYKKHGEPLPKEKASENNLRYLGIAKAELTDQIQKNIDNIKRDNALAIYEDIDPKQIVAEIKINGIQDRIALGEIKFNAPMSKEQAGYGEGDEALVETCDMCVHFAGFPLMGIGGSGICHVVSGLVEWSHSCNFYAKNLVIDTELEKVKEEIKQKKKKEYEEQMVNNENK